MTAQPAQPAQPIRTLDDDVATYLDLTDRIHQLEDQRKAVLARLADRGHGTHTTESGATVTVTPPNRRFNVDRAWQMLTPEQQAVCVSPDPKKVKGQLPPVVAESCYDEGTGAPRVVIK